MGYDSTTGTIIYWKPEHTCYLHISHHLWFYKYNSQLSTEDNNTPGYLMIKQDQVCIVNNHDQLNFIPCELDIYYTHFLYEKWFNMKLSYYLQERK